MAGSDSISHSCDNKCL